MSGVDQSDFWLILRVLGDTPNKQKCILCVQMHCFAKLWI